MQYICMKNVMTYVQWLVYNNEPDDDLIGLKHVVWWDKTRSDWCEEVTVIIKYTWFRIPFHSTPRHPSNYIVFIKDKFLAELIFLPMAVSEHVKAFRRDNKPISTSISAFHMQEWFNLVRDDVLRLCRTTPFAFGWLVGWLCHFWPVDGDSIYLQIDLWKNMAPKPKTTQTLY
jgi:hypothetical protein